MSRVREGFRWDINGLRALAVSAVLLYHFDVPGFGSGFAGVDIFFVISGFLMTGIVLEAMQAGEFSVWRFYLSRARRIWPALLVLCLALLAAGWFLLMPSEYQTLGKHARDSILFSSNLRYLKEAGYFAEASNQNWLLHTWSLSVEWQFYLLYPLLLMAAWKISPRRPWLFGALAALALAGFAYSVYLGVEAPEDGFFTLQSRAWEMLAGGLVYLVGGMHAFTATLRRIMAGMGLAAAMAAIVIFDTQTRWPGPWALLPVLATCLVILAEHQSCLFRTRVVQWLGERSYSIYLWHWPLVVGLVFIERQREPAWIALGVATALALGELSYRLVELPSRRWLNRAPALWASGVLLSVVLVAAGMAQLVRKSEFPGRLSDAVAQMEAVKNSHPRRIEECTHDQGFCMYGSGAIKGILIGDSHAGALVEAVQQGLGDAADALYFRGKAGCLMVFGARKKSQGSSECEALQEWVRTQLPAFQSGVPVILINRTTAYVLGGVPGEADQTPGRPEYFFSRSYRSPEPDYLNEFRTHYIDTLCQIAAHHPLYVMRPLPEMPVNVPNAMARDILLGRKREIAMSMDDYHARHGLIWQLQDEARERCGVRILDPLPYFCDERKCPAAIGGQPLFYDDDHPSNFAAQRLVPIFRQAFEAQ